LIETFNRSNEWGIHVQAQSAGGVSSLFNDVNALEGDNLPNLIAIPTEYLFTWYQTDGEMLVDMSDYVRHAQWGLTEDQIADFLPVFWQQDQIDAVRLGIPLLRNPSMLFYNLSWAQELGFYRSPVTPDEFREQACAAAQAIRSDNTVSNDGTGGWIVETRGETMWSWLRAFDADPFATGSKNYQFTGAESEAAFAFLREMLDENCAWKSRLNQPDEYFSGRQALFYSGLLEDTLIQSATMDRLGNEDQWTVIPYPSLDGAPVVVASGPSMAITTSTPEEQLASWLFLRWLVSPDHLAELTTAAGGLPVMQSMIADMQLFGAKQPQWRAGLTYLEQAQTPPSDSRWRTVRLLLEDAGYQALLTSTSPEQIPDVLNMLDEMIVELNGISETE
jgi:ABC-type glycerol-3-phosphate transport system substrate-binding protein